MQKIETLVMLIWTKKKYKAFTLIELLVSLRQECDKLWVCVLELARPRGFEPLTLGLEMRGFVVTNSTELSRFVILQ